MNESTAAAPKVGPKEFFLWAGAMVALYWSVLAFIFLIFDYINYALPDPLGYAGDPYSTGLPYDMASIVVMLPIYIALALVIRRDINRDPQLAGLWVRRWAIILTIFVTGLTMAGDLIVLLTAFFRGEAITEAFALKVAIVFLVAAALFMHFSADLRGYWDKYRARERAVCAAVALLGLVSIVAGFFIVGTPWQARLYRYDEQRVNDLRNIMYQVANYARTEHAMPAELSDLNNLYTGFVVPRDPQTGQSYEWIVVNDHNFEICATFSAPSQPQATARPMSAPTIAGDLTDSWLHGAGRTCFGGQFSKTDFEGSSTIAPIPTVAPIKPAQ